MKRRTFAKTLGMGILSVLAFVYGIPQDSPGYPFEFMGQIYLLPRKLGVNDSMVHEGIFYARGEFNGLSYYTMIPTDMTVLMLA